MYKLVRSPRPSMLQEPLLVSEETNYMYGVWMLTGSIVSEVLATLFMRLTQVSQLYRIPAYMLYGVSFSLFPSVIAIIPLSVAYATWSAVGMLFVTLCSFFLFGDALTGRQMLGLFGTVCSVVLMNS